ncbi:hypothetical protein [Acetohalobium arabaticum]|uniref:Uncharacterized protein n=1 Tax=Acetohalobium arabaticum (strain ATCC 49924 / DSM 5501 / Z-7288) TaxID=574087 RepID=D9QQE2_ACEAZ|nr:hypothetical protein [Acetohalobium arabaticum]ADL12733.1 hypothetical protein Acear_1214 [Acetohalobium arabaticum DSM 5501]
MNEFKELKKAKRVWNETADVTTKVILYQLNVECPNCKESYGSWKLLPPIQVINDRFHLVKYQCECSEVFKKIEDAREEE